MSRRVISPIGRKIDFNPPDSIFWNFIKIKQALEKLDPMDPVFGDIKLFSSIDMTRLYQDALIQNVPFQKVNEIVCKFFELFDGYQILTSNYDSCLGRDQKSNINILYYNRVILSLASERGGFIGVYFYLRNKDKDLNSTQVIDVMYHFINELGLNLNIGGNNFNQIKKKLTATDLIRDDLNVDQEIF